MSAQGTFKCRIDGKTFKTKAALKQHLSASHGTAKGGGKVGGPAKAGKSGVGAPVNASFSKVAKFTSGIRERGTDRLFHTDRVDSYGSGRIIVDTLITAGSFPRLAILSSAYQRVKWIKMVFTVQTMLNTSTNGGFVAAFIRDPDDDVPTNLGASKTLTWITSQQGSVTQKWWESAKITVTNFGERLFTSYGDETRFYSPGKFMLVVDSKASQSGSMTVYVDWEVELSGPSCQPDISEKTVGQRNVLVDLYTVNGKKGLWMKAGTDWKSSVAEMIDGAKVDEQFELQHPFAVMTTESAVVRLAWFIHITSDSVVGFKYEDPDDKTVQNQSVVENCVIRKGTVLKVHSGLNLNPNSPSASESKEVGLPVPCDSNPSPISSLEKSIKSLVDALNASRLPVPLQVQSVSPRTIFRSRSMESLRSSMDDWTIP